MGRNPSPNRFSDGQSTPVPAQHPRRSVCRAVVVSSLPLLAGCSEIASYLGGDPGEVTVFNNTDASLTATITVTDIESEETVLAETTDIAASEAAKFNDVFDAATRYRFEAETEDGLSDSYEWDLPSTDHYLYITINSSSIEFEENNS